MELCPRHWLSCLIPGWILSFVLLFVCPISFAVTAEELPDLTSLSDYKSPWTTPARPWLIGGVLLTGTLLAFKDQIGDPIQEEVVEHKPLGRYSRIGDYGGQLIPNALYVFGMFGAHWHSKDDKYLRYGLIMTKASAYAVATSTVLKYAAREKRPNSNSRSSFPSGHSTAAFAFASVVVAEHGLWPYGVPALMLASLTAFSRINDNQHYLHDVVAGATIGTAFGLGVSYANRNSKTDTASSWIFLPRMDSTAGIIALHDF